MVKVAVIGFGDHVKRNILPALLKMNLVLTVGVFVRNPDNYKHDEIIDDVNIYNISIINEHSIDWVIIATPINTHFDIASEMLKMNINVICEKPLTEDIDKTKMLFELAQKSSLKVHEVCMYQYHKQFLKLQERISSCREIKWVEAEFSIPKLNPDNIRYDKGLCGGAVLDVGYYPISIIITLFGKPRSFKFITNSEPGRNVDTTGVAIFEFKNFNAIAKWNIGSSYKNVFSFEDRGKVYQYQRIFSKPPFLETEELVFDGTDEQVNVIGKDDHFVNYYTSVFTGNIDYNHKDRTLLFSQALSEIYTDHIRK